MIVSSLPPFVRHDASPADIRPRSDAFALDRETRQTARTPEIHRTPDRERDPRPERPADETRHDRRVDPRDRSEEARRPERPERPERPDRPDRPEKGCCNDAAPQTPAQPVQAEQAPVDTETTTVEVASTPVAQTPQVTADSTTVDAAPADVALTAPIAVALQTQEIDPAASPADTATETTADTAAVPQAAPVEDTTADPSVVAPVTATIDPFEQAPADDAAETVTVSSLLPAQASDQARAATADVALPAAAVANSQRPTLQSTAQQPADQAVNGTPAGAPPSGDVAHAISQKTEGNTDSGNGDSDGDAKSRLGPPVRNGLTAHPATPEAKTFNPAALAPADQAAVKPAAPIDPAKAPIATRDVQPVAGDTARAPDLSAAFGTGRNPVSSATAAASYQARAAAPVQPAAEQVAFQVSRAVQGGHERLTVELKPAELGRVTVELDVHDHKHVKVVMGVERADTLHMLQRDAHAIERMLQDAGLKTDGNSLSFNLQQGSGDGRTGHQASAPSQAPAGAFTGEPEPSAESLVIHAAVPSDRVDIRV